MRKDVIDFSKELKSCSLPNETITGFIQRIGIQRTIWYAWEKGSAVPSAKNIKKAGQALNWEPVRILKWQAKLSGSDDIYAKALEYDTILEKYSVMYENYKNLSSNSKTKLIKYWTKLANHDGVTVNFNGLL